MRKLRSLPRARLQAGPTSRKGPRISERTEAGLLKTGDAERLVVFVDGLDEGTDETSFTGVLTTGSPEKILLFIRPGRYRRYCGSIWTNRQGTQKRVHRSTLRQGRGKGFALRFRKQVQDDRGLS